MSPFHGLRKAAAFLAAVALALPAAALAQARLPEPLSTYVEKSRLEWEVPGIAVAVVRADEPPIAQGFGVRRMGRPERVDADTVFNIASLTKSFTAAGAAVLVDEGKLGWDDPVAKWRPDVKFGDPWLSENVTLADLLSHRTGLQSANTMFGLTNIDRPEILRRLRYLKPSAGFRTEQVYNNVLYTLAGEVTAAAAGSSYEDLIRTRLVAPLGMTATTVGAPVTQGNVASPHAPLGGRQQPIRFASYASIAPAGAMNSTAADMARWLRFQLGDGTWEGRRIISAETMDAMHQPWTPVHTTPQMRANRQVEGFAGYGLGWNVMDYRGRKLLWHSGNADGMPSFMALLPNERIGVVIMLNTWQAPYLHNEIASRILDHYLGLPTRDYSAEMLARTRASEAKAAEVAKAKTPTAKPSPPLDLAAYEGVYLDDLFGPVVITRKGAALALRLGDRGEAADLKPFDRDTFEVRWRDRVIGEDNDTRAVFALDPDGKVARLSMMVRRDQIEARRKAD